MVQAEEISQKQSFHALLRLKTQRIKTLFRCYKILIFEWLKLKKLTPVRPCVLFICI